MTKQIKATNKFRKKIFYNIIDKQLYVEIKIGSGVLKNEKGEKIKISDINNLNIYIDLSLFPAHMLRSYGRYVIENDIFINKIYWLFKKDKYPVLIYVDGLYVVRDTYVQISFRKINNKGIIINKQNILTIPNDGYLRECNENYKIETKIKLI